MNSTNECGLYFIDDNFKIIYFNDAVKKMYPEIETGQQCYKALACLNDPCPHCPMTEASKQNSFYNNKRHEWIHAQVAEAELPVIGKCRSITFSRSLDNTSEKHEYTNTSADINLQNERTGMIGGYCEDGFPLYFVNKKMIEMLGYDDYDDFVEGTNGLVANTIHPDDMAQVVKDIGPEYYVGLEYTTVYRMPKKDGSWFWTIDKGHVIKADDGRLAIVSYCTDITDSMHDQERLENQNQLLRKQNRLMEFINDGMPGGYHRCSAEEGYPFQYISDKFLNMLGFTREEIANRFDNKFINLVHPDDRMLLINASESTLHSSEKLEINIHYRMITKTGYLQVVDCTRISEYDGVKFFQGVIIDISSSEAANEPDGSIEMVRDSLKNALIREQQYRDQLKSLQDETFDSISCGVFAYTLPERKLLSVNNAAKRMIGCGENDDPIQELKRFLTESIIPEDRKTVADAKKFLVNYGDSHIQDYQAIVNGSKINLHTNIKYLKNTNGQPYILVTMFDTTEQVLSEQRIDEERRQYRNALAYGSIGFFTLDLTNGIIDQPVFSKKGEDLTDILGIKPPADYNTFADIWFADKRIMTEDKTIDIVKDRRKLIECCHNGTSMLDVEYSVPDDNSYYHLVVLLYEIDERTYASFIIYDISTDKHEERQRRSIIDSLGNIYSALYHFSFKEQKCMTINVNEEYSPVLPEKCSISEFYNTYTQDYIADEHKETVEKFLKPENIINALTNENYISLEFRRKNLGWYRVTLVAAERDEHGAVTTAVFAGNIIEKQKQAELVQQEALRAAYESANIANSAKTNFLANMSHDIRTPMNAIIGMTAIAGTHLDDRERVADCLSKISISSKHLLGIINEVLDMSKIESGKMELQEDEFNLSELIDNLLTMSKPSVNAKGHELSVSIKNINHEDVIGDSQRIQQVFMNLMNNAIKYTPDGGKISLTISEKATNKHKIGCYEFIFEDNGIGMKESFLKHIFEPFSRATNDERVDKIQGTGLGMPITQNIIHMMNGTINVESKLNEGTKITVEIFLPLKNNGEKISYEKFIDLPVLVADDDETSCIYTCELLKEIKMKGEWVLSGKEAVEKACMRHEKNDDFFAVILDWKMPDMDGVETTKELRRRIGKDVPIIIISAYDWTDIELEARAAGANAFISKPLFKSRVIHLFKELIGEESDEKITSELEAISKADLTGKRALLVEDNELNAEIAGEILGMTGLEVEYAVNGKDALNIMSNVEDGYFSVIFMDIQMPIMNGYEASRAIRELPGNYAKSVPILAMTANAFAEDVAAAKNAGMNEHIAKPLDFNQLIKVLKKWIG